MLPIIDDHAIDQLSTMLVPNTFSQLNKKSEDLGVEEGARWAGDEVGRI